MVAANKPPGYLRLETDDEFRARISPALFGWSRSYIDGLKGEQLDIYVWDVVRKQRKLIEVIP